MILAAGALLGFIGVAFGAYAEHGLRDGTTADAFHSVMTAVRYNQLHAVVIVAIGLALQRSNAPPRRSVLFGSAWLFVVGTVLFSFTIYLAAFGLPGVNRLTPLGGLLLMAGWLALAWAGLRSWIGRDA